MYKRVFIFGSVGSGKTTLATKLSKLTRIKFYTLGEIVYKVYPKIRYSSKERDKKLKDIVNKKQWIIEGAYWNSWILPAFKKADFVIIINLKTNVILKQIVKRMVKKSLKGDHTNTKTIKKQLQFISSYRGKNLKKYKKLVEKYKKKSIILQSRKEIDDFLEKFKP